jgi:RimJ/RimL family protein N-acetyltransferase
MQIETVKLIPFTINHYKFIQDEIKSAKFLMQWAGPKYIYPLKWEQIKNQIEEQDETGYKNYLYSAQCLNSHEIIGHVQLSRVDSKDIIGNIGSVLVFSKFRNNGIGSKILKEIMNIGFIEKQMIELRLGVFDFNFTAIKCYQKIGFTKYCFEENAREIENE